MRKLISIALAITFGAVFYIGTASTAVADELVPLAYAHTDSSVMGGTTSGDRFVTMMEMGASARRHTAALDVASGAGRSHSNAGNGGGADFQWGSSQTDQSWKKAKTVEEAQVRGLVPGDCGGENTTDTYRRQMNQNRKGYLQEPVISNSQCGAYHATLSGPTVNQGASNDYGSTK